MMAVMGLHDLLPRSVEGVTLSDSHSDHFVSLTVEIVGIDLDGRKTGTGRLLLLLSLLSLF
jgi:hypothetical protein